MGQITDGDTKVILKKLAILLPLFYVLVYIVAVIATAALGLKWEHLGTLPFEFEQFGVEVGRPLGSFLCVVIAFVLGAILIFFVVKSTKRGWDYALTIGILHISISCAVRVAFPLNWVWWVTVLAGTFILSSLSEIMCYFLRDMRDIKVDH